MANRRDEYDDDDRPRARRRRNGDDNDFDDRPIRRNQARESKDGQAEPKRLNVFGLLALIIGIVSLIISFIPCLGMMAFLTGSIGLLKSVITLAFSYVGNNRDMGKGIPVAAVITNALSLIVALIMVFVVKSFFGGINLPPPADDFDIETAEAIKIDAVQLSKEYSTNVVKAETTYDRKVVEVTGRVKLVSRERSWKTTVELGTNDDYVDCDFAEDQKAGLASIEIGQIVTIRGRVKGLDSVTNFVVLEKCRLVIAPAATTPSTKPSGTSSTKPSPAKAVVTDAAKLLKDYDMNSAKADGMYKDKYLELSVKIDQVSNDGDLWTILATAENDEQAGTILFEFSVATKSQLAKLKSGQKATIRGFCKWFDDRVILTDCVLVK